MDTYMCTHMGMMKSREAPTLWIKQRDFEQFSEEVDDKLNQCRRDKRKLNRRIRELENAR